LGAFFAQDVTRPDQQKRQIRPTLSSFGSIIPRPQQQQKQPPVAALGQRQRQQQPQNCVQSNAAQQAVPRTTRPQTAPCGTSASTPRIGAENCTNLERQGGQQPQQPSSKIALSTGGQSLDMGRVPNQRSMTASVPQLGLQPCRQGARSATCGITAASVPQSPQIAHRQGLRSATGGSTTLSMLSGSRPATGSVAAASAPQSPRLSPRMATRQGLRPATGSVAAASAPQSPRLSPGMATRPVRLSDLGAMLPRPQQQLQLHRQRIPLQQEQAAVGHAASDLAQPDTNSSVVYEQDGFELFYGVKGAGGEEEGVEVSSRPTKRDGFDRFYGIRNRDRPSSAKRPSSASQPTLLDTSEVAEQSRLCQSPRAAFRVLAPKSAESSTQKQFSEAPTYSVATPAVPVSTTVDSVPSGVQFFPVYTPARS